MVASNNVSRSKGNKNSKKQTPASTDPAIMAKVTAAASNNAALRAAPKPYGDNGNHNSKNFFSDANKQKPAVGSFNVGGFNKVTPKDEKFQKLLKNIIDHQFVVVTETRGATEQLKELSTHINRKLKVDKKKFRYFFKECKSPSKTTGGVAIFFRVENGKHQRYKFMLNKTVVFNGDGSQEHDSSSYVKTKDVGIHCVALHFTVELDSVIEPSSNNSSSNNNNNNNNDKNKDSDNSSVAAAQGAPNNNSSNSQLGNDNEAEKEKSETQQSSSNVTSSSSLVTATNASTSFWVAGFYLPNCGSTATDCFKNCLKSELVAKDLSEILSVLNAVCGNILCLGDFNAWFKFEYEDRESKGHAEDRGDALEKLFDENGLAMVYPVDSKDKFLPTHYEGHCLDIGLIGCSGEEDESGFAPVDGTCMRYLMHREKDHYGISFRLDFIDGSLVDVDEEDLVDLKYHAMSFHSRRLLLFYKKIQARKLYQKLKKFAAEMKGKSIKTVATGLDSILKQVQYEMTRIVGRSGFYDKNKTEEERAEARKRYAEKLNIPASEQVETTNRNIASKIHQGISARQNHQYRKRLEKLQNASTAVPTSAPTTAATAAAPTETENDSNNMLTSSSANSSLPVVVTGTNKKKNETSPSSSSPLSQQEKKAEKNELDLKKFSHNHEHIPSRDVVTRLAKRAAKQLGGYNHFKRIDGEKKLEEAVKTISEKDANAIAAGEFASSRGFTTTPLDKSHEKPKKVRNSGQSSATSVGDDAKAFISSTRIKRQNFKLVGPAELKIFMKEFKKYSSDSHAFCTEFFLNCADCDLFLDIVSELFNRIFLDDGYLPLVLATTDVVPVPKEKEDAASHCETADTDNYRYLGINTYFARLMEKCWISRVIQIVMKKKSIHPTVFGHLAQCNAENGLLLITEFIANHLRPVHGADGVAEIGSIILDFVKAFSSLEFAFIEKAVRNAVGDENASYSKFIMHYLKNIPCAFKINGERFTAPERDGELPSVATSGSGWYLGNVFSNERGCMEGNILSPFVFMLCMSDISKLLDAEVAGSDVMQGFIKEMQSKHHGDTLGPKYAGVVPPSDQKVQGHCVNLFVSLVDDAKLLFAHTDPDKLRLAMEEYLQLLLKVLKVSGSGLKLNYGKCKLGGFTSRDEFVEGESKRIKKVNSLFDPANKKNTIKVKETESGVPIILTFKKQCYKFFGIWFDSQFNFSHHLGYLISKIKKKLEQLEHFCNRRNSIPAEKMTLVLSKMLGPIRYCSASWFPHIHELLFPSDAEIADLSSSAGIAAKNYKKFVDEIEKIREPSTKDFGPSIDSANIDRKSLEVYKEAASYVIKENGLDCSLEKFNWTQRGYGPTIGIFIKNFIINKKTAEFEAAGEMVNVPHRQGVEAFTSDNIGRGSGGSFEDLAIAISRVARFITNAQRLTNSEKTRILSGLEDPHAMFMKSCVGKVSEVLATAPPSSPLFKFLRRPIHAHPLQDNEKKPGSSRTRYRRRYTAADVLTPHERHEALMKNIPFFVGVENELKNTEDYLGKNGTLDGIYGKPITFTNRRTTLVKIQTADSSPVIPADFCTSVVFAPDDSIVHRPPIFDIDVAASKSSSTLNFGVNLRNNNKTSTSNNSSNNNNSSGLSFQQVILDELKVHQKQDLKRLQAMIKEKNIKKQEARSRRRGGGDKPSEAPQVRSGTAKARRDKNFQEYEKFLQKLSRLGRADQDRALSTSQPRARTPEPTPSRNRFEKFLSHLSVNEDISSTSRFEDTSSQARAHFKQVQKPPSHEVGQDSVVSKYASETRSRSRPHFDEDTVVSSQAISQPRSRDGEDTAVTSQARSRTPEPFSQARQRRQEQVVAVSSSSKTTKKKKRQQKEKEKEKEQEKEQDKSTTNNKKKKKKKKEDSNKEHDEAMVNQMLELEDETTATNEDVSASASISKKKAEEEKEKEKEKENLKRNHVVLGRAFQEMPNCRVIATDASHKDDRASYGIGYATIEGEGLTFEQVLYSLQAQMEKSLKVKDVKGASNASQAEFTALLDCVEQVRDVLKEIAQTKHPENTTAAERNFLVATDHLSAILAVDSLNQDHHYLLEVIRECLSINFDCNGERVVEHLRLCHLYAHCGLGFHDLIDTAARDRVKELLGETTSSSSAEISTSTSSKSNNNNNKSNKNKLSSASAATSDDASIATTSTVEVPVHKTVKNFKKQLQRNVSNHHKLKDIQVFVEAELLPDNFTKMSQEDQLKKFNPKKRLCSFKTQAAARKFCSANLNFFAEGGGVFAFALKEGEMERPCHCCKNKYSRKTRAVEHFFTDECRLSVSNSTNEALQDAGIGTLLTETSTNPTPRQICSALTASIFEEKNSNMKKSLNKDEVEKLTKSQQQIIDAMKNLSHRDLFYSESKTTNLAVDWFFYSLMKAKHFKIFVDEEWEEVKRKQHQDQEDQELLLQSEQDDSAESVENANPSELDTAPAAGGKKLKVGTTFKVKQLSKEQTSSSNNSSASASARSSKNNDTKPKVAATRAGKQRQQQVKRDKKPPGKQQQQKKKK